MKYRIHYSKRREAKFVSHLDMVRLFGRAFSRAALPLAYSEGFNPHPKLVFGLPLPVGAESLGEYVDAELGSFTEPGDAARRLEAVMPHGIEILGIRRLEEGEHKVMPASAEYIVDWSGSPADESILARFLAREDIRVIKRTKRGESLTDIRPHILKLRPIENGGGGAAELPEAGPFRSALFMRLSAGSQANLKPELVLDAMHQYIEGFRAEDVGVLRLRILDASGRDLAQCF